MKRMLTFISIHSFYLKLRKFLRFKWLRKLFVVFSTRFDTNHISFSRIAEKLPFHVAEPCVSFPSRQLEPSTRRSGISASRPGWIGSACGKWPVQIKQTECQTRSFTHFQAKPEWLPWSCALWRTSSWYSWQRQPERDGDGPASDQGPCWGLRCAS